MIANERDVRDFAVAAFVLALAATVVMLPLLMAGGWPASHEEVRYWRVFEGFRDAFLHGALYPRWMPEVYGGYGYPTFVFYQPGFFFYWLPFSFLPLAPLSQITLALCALVTIGGMGAYLAAKRLGDTFTALLVAVIFILTPYHFSNLYVRGALGELTAAMAVPWAIYFLIALRDAVRRAEGGEWRGAFGLGIAIAAVAYSHPATSLIFLPVLGALAIVVAWPMGLAQGWRLLLHAGLGVSIGLTLSAPYWFTVITSLPLVDNKFVQGDYLPTLHLVYPEQFFLRTWDFGDSGLGPDDRMSFQLGLPHFILALSGMILGWREPVIRGVFALYLLLLAAMTPIAAELWKISLLLNVQFPWRALSVTASLQAIACAGLVALSRDAPRLRPLLAITLIAIFAGWHNNLFRTREPATAVTRDWIEGEMAKARLRFETNDLVNAWTPKTALAARPDQPREQLVTLEGPGQITAAPGASAYRLEFDLDLPGAAPAVINQIYFPGWVVRLDGRDIPAAELEAGLTPDGRPEIVLPAGRHRLLAYYDGPPGWRARNGVILAVLAALGAALWRLRLRPDS